MKVVIINKSDTTGGAAVVSFRLMKALRAAGVDARMLVAEKLTDSEFVALAAKPLQLKRAFLAERLKIFLANGLDRKTLFKIDTATDGVDISRHPWVADADIVCLNWVNQGLLSLRGIKRLMNSGKKIVWTMHDMWNFTGVCHHAGTCIRYREECGHCPLLTKGRRSEKDISYKTLIRKQALYGKRRIHFVAVSHWVEGLAKKSTLLANQPISVIPNAFPFNGKLSSRDSWDPAKRKLRILFGAARLDDPVKGLPILIEATRRLKEKYPDFSEKVELITFGHAKHQESLEGIAIAARHLGTIRDPRIVEKLYRSCDIVVSTSLYETLPGTLVEGQAYGCIPVSFARGGQPDIVDHLQTGFLAKWSDDLTEAADFIVEGIVWASAQGAQTRRRMLESAQERFSSQSVAEAYIKLFESL